MARVLSIIPYEFYPPKYGGALRCFYLLRELAKYHEVCLLTVQRQADFIEDKQPVFPRTIQVVSTADTPGYRTVFNVFPNRVANALNSRILKRSILQKGNLYLLQTYPVLRRLFADQRFDFVLYENLECFQVLHPQVKRLSPGVQHLYDAHNVDSELWQQLYQSELRPELKQYAEMARITEKQLHRNVSLCLTCSLTDQQKLNELNDGRLRTAVVANGVDTAERPFDPNPEKHLLANLLFCGTLDYAPNQRGLTWFYEQVLPLVRNVRNEISLTVIGKLNTPMPYDKLKADPAVRFIGTVEHVQPYYRESAIVVVPLLSGSGTRLKILEAMSMGNPVVSTTVGAEGLGLKEEIWLADDPASFAAAILGLLENRERFEQQRVAARQLVERHYDWKMIGRNLNKELSVMLEEANQKVHV